MNKRIAAALLGVTTCGAVPATAQTPVRANAATAVRSSANATATQIGSVPSGHVYAATDKSGTWWRVFYDGRLGYVAESSVTALTGVSAVKIVMDYLYVRSGPGNAYANLGSLSAGQYYTLNRETAVGGWWEIRWGGRLAYVPSGSAYTTKLTLPPPGGRLSTTKAFVWPVNAWVTATTMYRWGDPHDGTADLAAPYGSPVGAVRDGKVTYVSSGTGYGLSISHAEGYRSQYHHFLALPPVKVGDLVQTNQAVGSVGRTGYANNPHCHFQLNRWGARLAVPGLAYGQWAGRGAYIPGVYTDLGATTPLTSAYSVRVAGGSIEVRSGAAQSYAVLGTVAKGALLTAYGTGAVNGYLRIAWNGGTGYVPQTSVEAASGAPFGVVTTASTTVRSAADAGSASVGTIAARTLVTVFASSNGWDRILFGYPTVYRWIAAGTTAATAEYQVMICADKVDVMSGPGSGYALVGTITLSTYNDLRRVYETRNGWCRIVHNGKTGWIPGWRTAGRI